VAVYQSSTKFASARARQAVHVGRRIRELRLERRLSQAELAELAGVPRQRVGDWEAGRYLPSPESLEQLAAALEVEWWSLYAGNAVSPQGEEA
jgi:transcriptional regulator with XRE-family HTH domain